MSEEPWLGGPVAGIIPDLQPVAHDLIFAKHELKRVFASISDDDIWKTPGSATSISYHVRHAAGSMKRMLTYARGKSLTEEQIAEIVAERAFDASLKKDDLISIAYTAIHEAMDFLKGVKAEQLNEERLVGRKKLTTNLRGLLYEIATHTSRHVGQIATTARVLH